MSVIPRGAGPYILAKAFKGPSLLWEKLCMQAQTLLFFGYMEF